MRLRILRAIYVKEIVEALRDRRTLFMMIALPLLLYPVLMVVMSRLQESQQAAQSERPSLAAVWGRMPAGFEAQVKSQGKIDLAPWVAISSSTRTALEAGAFSEPTRKAPKREADLNEPERDTLPSEPWASEARDAILSRKADAVLLFWPGAGDKLDSGGLASATILYDSVRPESRRARSRLDDELRIYRHSLTAGREKARGLEPGFAQVLNLQQLNVAPAKRQSGMFIGMMLPYMLIMFSLLSGFYASIDMTAGEKERGTMQTLLCAPVKATEIIGGKFLAVWTISILATLVNLVSLGLTFTRIKLMPGVDSSLPISSYLIAFLLVLPVTFMVNSVFLAIGAFARDFKDGQNYLTPVLMGLIVPLVVTMMPGMELNAHLAFVPMVNIALLIKGVFLGEWRADMLFLVLLSSFIYAGLALSFAAAVFRRNNLLLGGKESVGGVLEFKRAPGSRPSASVALVAFSVALVLGFYGSLTLMERSVTLGLLITEYGFFLLPVLAAIYLKGYAPKEALSLRTISPVSLLSCIVLGLTAWTIAAGLIIRVLPPPPSLVKALEKILLLGDKPEPLWITLLVVAISPAICEEAMFRGLMLSGFRGAGKWPAILLTALLFGFAHASIYRMLPTFFLGIIMGWVVWQTRSILAGIVVHALNNGFVAVLARWPKMATMLGLDGRTEFVPWHVTIAGSALFAAAALLLWHTTRERSQPDSAALRT